MLLKKQELILNRAYFLGKLGESEWFLVTVADGGLSRGCQHRFKIHYDSRTFNTNLNMTFEVGECFFKISAEIIDGDENAKPWPEYQHFIEGLEDVPF